MPLDDNAKISDIITSLEGMQGINQKAELASVIGAPATSSDNIATQITKVQDAKNVFASKIGVPNTTPLQEMADGLVVGKKQAGGIIKSSSSQALFTDSSDSNAYKYFVEVVGLDFKPSTIYLTFINGAPNSSSYTENMNANGIKFMQLMEGQYAYFYKVNVQSCIVELGRFKLPVVASNTDFVWVAYE